jgi:phosphatidylglycerophosphate synthase
VLKKHVLQNAPSFPVHYELLGTCDWKVWGCEVSHLLEEALQRVGLGPAPDEAPGPDSHLAIFHVGTFFDRSAINMLIKRPSSAIVEFVDGDRVRPVAVLCPASEADTWRALLLQKECSREDLPDHIELIDAGDPPMIYDYELRRQSRPFILEVGPESRNEIEHTTFGLAYKGVTDVVTKYVFPTPAFYATRFAARLGLKPNTVTAASFVLVLVALYLFYQGHFAIGLCAGYAMSFLDTVDGKLARVTQTSSHIGNLLDHGIDQIHPPFWWLAWWHGAALDPTPSGWTALAYVLFFGYIALRLQEWHFKSTFGLRIHVWRPFDSRFRLITSRRNPNLILLTLSVLAGRPDLGIVAVGFWTLASLAIHSTRSLQAAAAIRQKGPLRSWIETAVAS